MKLSFAFLLLAAPICVSAQKVFTNKPGGYQITAPEGWSVEQNEDVMRVYAPDEGEMDTWKEKIEISLTDANDLGLEEGFQFYLEQDLPSMYNEFKVIKQGEEVVHGLPVKWAIISFAGSGTIGTNEVSFTLHGLFFLAFKNGKFFMLNGVAEKDYFAKLENDFLKISRSFQILK